MILFALLIGFLIAPRATGHAWILEINVDKITPGLTQNVQLECKQDASPARPNGLAKITRIRITKQNPYCSLDTFADIREGENATTRSQDVVTVTGNVTTPEDAFLKVTWPNATTNTAGAYGCEIDGYDTLENFASLKAKPLLVTEKKLTVDDINKLVDVRQKALELQIANLKTLVEDGMKGIQEKFQKDVELVRSEILHVNETMQTKYATRNELAENISDLKNVTISKMTTERYQYENHNRELLSLVEKVNVSSQTKILEIVSGYSNAIDHLYDKVNEMEEENKNHLSQINSKLERVESRIGSTNTTNCELLVNTNETSGICSCQTTLAPTQNQTQNVATETITSSRTTTATNTTNCEHLMNTNETCQTTLAPTQNQTQNVGTEATTTISSRTTTANSLRWPDGSYALVKPSTGCSLPFSPIDSQSPKDSLYKLYVQTNVQNIALSYCYQDRPVGQSVWPKGSYCIVPHKGVCPREFFKGAIQYRFHDVNGQPMSQLDTAYCCRSDRRADYPIRLPTEKPFYLLRYNSTCQQVAGMAVSGDSIRPRKAINLFSLDTTETGTHPDIDEEKTAVHLCHYEPK